MRGNKSYTWKRWVRFDTFQSRLFFSEWLMRVICCVCWRLFTQKLAKWFFFLSWLIIFVSSQSKINWGLCTLLENIVRELRFVCLIIFSSNLSHTSKPAAVTQLKIWQLRKLFFFWDSHKFESRVKNFWSLFFESKSYKVSAAGEKKYEF